MSFRLKPIPFTIAPPAPTCYGNRPISLSVFTKAAKLSRPVTAPTQPVNRQQQLLFTMQRANRELPLAAVLLLVQHRQFSPTVHAARGPWYSLMVNRLWAYLLAGRT